MVMMMMMMMMMMTVIMMMMMTRCYVALQRPVDQSLERCTATNCTVCTTVGIAITITIVIVTL